MGVVQGASGAASPTSLAITGTRSCLLLLTHINITLNSHTRIALISLVITRVTQRDQVAIATTSLAEVHVGGNGLSVVPPHVIAGRAGVCVCTGRTSHTACEGAPYAAHTEGTCSGVML